MKILFVGEEKGGLYELHTPSNQVELSQSSHSSVSFSSHVNVVNYFRNCLAQ